MARSTHTIQVVACVPRVTRARNSTVLHDRTREIRSTIENAREQLSTASTLHSTRHPDGLTSKALQSLLEACQYPSIRKNLVLQNFQDHDGTLSSISSYRDGTRRHWGVFRNHLLATFDSLVLWIPRMTPQCYSRIRWPSGVAHWCIRRNLPEPLSVEAAR